MKRIGLFLSSLLCLCTALALPSFQVQRSIIHSNNNDGRADEDDTSKLSSTSSSSLQRQRRQQSKSFFKKKRTGLFSTTTSMTEESYQDLIPIGQRNFSNGTTISTSAAISSSSSSSSQPVMDVTRDFSNTAAATTTTSSPSPLSFSETNSSQQQLQIQQNQIQQKKNTLAIVLMTITGITEAICFRKFGCYPNMMTGNTVRCMSALAEFQFGTVLSHGSMVLCYILGSGLFQAIDMWCNNNNNKNTRQLQQQRQTPTLIHVSRIALILLGLSDIVGRISISSSSSSIPSFLSFLRLPIMAIAFGMINAASLKESGYVTNAITGHWNKVGVGAAELLLWNMVQPNHHPSTKGTTTANIKGLVSSMRIAMAFLSSLFVTTLLYMWVETKQPAILLRLLPPLGTSLGVLYMLVFGWYCQK